MVVHFLIALLIEKEVVHTSKVLKGVPLKYFKYVPTSAFVLEINNRFQFGYLYVDKNGNNTHRSVSVSSRYLGSNSTYNYYIQHGNELYQNSNFSIKMYL